MNLDLVLTRGRSPGTRRRGRVGLDDGAGHVTRRDGVGRHVRPHRRWVRPLLGRRAVAGPSLREDALRPGAAVAGLRPRRGDVPGAAVATDRRGDRHVRAARDDARTRAGSRPPRTPTPRSRRSQPRGPVPHVDARRGPGRARRRTGRGRGRWRTTTSRRPGTSRRAGRSRTASRTAATGTGRRTSKQRVRHCSRRAPFGLHRGSTTRC